MTFLIATPIFLLLFAFIYKLGYWRGRIDECEGNAALEHFGEFCKPNEIPI